MEVKTNKAQTILTIVLGFTILYWIFKKDWLLYIAMGIGVLGLFSETFAGIIEKGWLKLAEILGRINGSILLTLIFFLFLTPVAFLMRLFKGGDQLKLKKQDKTVFLERNHSFEAKDMENIW